MSERPYLIVCHANPDVRARLAAHLRDVGRVDCVEELNAILDLLALAAAHCLVVDLPATAAGRGVLGRIVAAYPDTHVIAIAASLRFDDARDLLRLGVHDIVPSPPDAAAVAAAVREGLTRRHAGGAPGLRGTVILVASGKGGVGCTAIALHLTAALARHGTAAAVDADAPPFGAMAAAADLDTGSSIAGLVRQHLPIEAKVLRRVGLAHAAGFATFALWAAPGDADEVLDAIPATMDALTTSLPFVVVDLGRPVLPAQRLLSRRATVAVAVATLDLLALRSVRALIELLASDGVARILPVLNRHGGPASYTVSQAEAALGTPFAAVLPETAHVSRCLDDGTLVGAAAPDDPWWRAVEHLAGQIVDRRREEFRGALGSAP
jgi:pilus assembly protein CpaE